MKLHAVKVGDIYKVPTDESQACGTFNAHVDSGASLVRVTKISTSNGKYSTASYDILDESLAKLSSCSSCFSFRFEQFPYYKKSNSKTNMSLIESFRLATKSEPEKSFIKAGILEMDESFTAEGEELFMLWLLAKEGADFKTEVVDPILAEEEAKS